MLTYHPPSFTAVDQDKYTKSWRSAGTNTQILVYESGDYVINLGPSMGIPTNTAFYIIFPTAAISEPAAPFTTKTVTVIEILPFTFPPDQISHSRLWPPYLQIRFSKALTLSNASSLSITSPTVMGTSTMTTCPSILPLNALFCIQAWSTS